MPLWVGRSGPACSSDRSPAFQEMVPPASGLRPPSVNIIEHLSCVRGCVGFGDKREHSLAEELS